MLCVALYGPCDDLVRAVPLGEIVSGTNAVSEVDVSRIPSHGGSTIRTFKRFPGNPEWIRKLNSAPIGTLAEARGLARELRRAFRKDSHFNRFDQVIQAWITDPHRCRQLREEASEWLRSDAGTEDSMLLLRALAHAEPSAPELYQGRGEEGTVWSVLGQYNPGSSFELSLASFTSDWKWAEDFARMDAEDVGWTEVVYVLP